MLFGEEHLPYENSKQPPAPSEGGLFIHTFLQMAEHFSVLSLQCNRQHLSHSFNFSATSENSHQIRHFTGVKSYVQSTTEMI